MSREREERIRTLAGSQHGLVSRTQLLELGVSPSAIGRRLKAGHLRALHGGVYLLGPLLTDRTPEMAATMAGGPSALLSHVSAATAWTIRPLPSPRPIHVSVPGGGRGRRRGIRFHRPERVSDDERSVVDAIPITSIARTLVDIAGMLGTREVERALSVAEREGLIGRDELDTLPVRYARWPGMSALGALIREEAGLHLTRSEAERRCLELLRSAGLPRPYTNVPMGPYELDLFWPDENVAIEVDGRAHHSSRPRFEGDRRKDAWLRTRGIEVIRLTWRQITRSPLPTVTQVGQILALGRARTRLPRTTSPHGSPPDSPLSGPAGHMSQSSPAQGTPTGNIPETGT